MIMKTDYSVVIPTYNGFKRLPIVLDSLFRQSISKEKFEVVVVDDGSRGLAQADINEMYNRYTGLQLKILRMPTNKGASAARNFGIENSIGKIIFFTDDDCEVPSLWMETHLDIYDKNPKVSAIGGWYAYPLHIQRRNIYALFFTLRWEVIFFPFYFEAVDSDTLEVRRRNMLNTNFGFMAENSANLSIRRLVTAKVKFDERFGSGDGFEDCMFSRTIREAGFVIYAIPFFTYHHKQMSLRSFLKMLINYSRGLYLLSNVSRVYSVSVTQKILRTKLIQYVNELAKTSSLIKRKRIGLVLLAYVHYFIFVNFDFLHRRH